MTDEALFVLLADDDENDRFLFQEAFNELKFPVEVQTVKNGEQLMEYLDQQDLVLPHILFLDLNMPRKNGLECLKEIRGKKALKHLPIAIYSTSGSEQDIEDTFVNGANVYIKKPNDFSLLKEALSKVLLTTYRYKDPAFNRDNFLLQI